jgi:hypothetical protein
MILFWAAVCSMFSFLNRESWKYADPLYVLRQGLTHVVSQSRNLIWCTTIRTKNLCCCAGDWIINTVHFRLKHLVKLFLKTVFWNRNLNKQIQSEKLYELCYRLLIKLILVVWIYIKHWDNTIIWKIHKSKLQENDYWGDQGLDTD